MTKDIGLQELQKALGIIGEIARQSGAEMTLRFPAGPVPTQPLVNHEPEAPSEDEEIKQLLESLPLTDDDKELLEKEWVSTTIAGAYFDALDAEPGRTIRRWCEEGVLLAEKRGRNWLVCTKSCVLKMHGVADSRSHFGIVKNE